MSSPHDQPTRVHPPAQPPAPAPAPALDLKTLIITAAASALAAFICSKVWAPGTLASAAFTPVAVAIFREALRKPTEVVTTALPAALPITRRAGAADPYGATRAPLADDAQTQVHRVVPGEGDPTRVVPGAGGHDDPTRVVPGAGGHEAPYRVVADASAHVPAAAAVGAVPVRAGDPRIRRRWQIAIGTGLLGFVVAAFLITVPEVIAGKNETTIFRGGGGNAPARTETVPATTTTVLQQVTTVPAETITQTTTVPTTTTTETETVTQEAPPTTTERTTPTTTTTPTRTTPTTPETPTTEDVPEAVVP